MQGWQMSKAKKTLAQTFSTTVMKAQEVDSNRVRVLLSATAMSA
jgi:hypothetical protein